MTETNPLPFHPQADIIDRILKAVKELKRSESYPDHICAKAGRITAQAGKVAEAADAVKYDLESQAEVIKHAVWTAAQSIRLIENLIFLPKTIKTHDTTNSTTITESAEDNVSENPEREG